MLKTSKGIEFKSRLGKGRVEVGGNGNDKINDNTTSSMLRTSLSMDSPTSKTKSAVKYNKVDSGGKLVKKLSKSQRIVNESKSFKGLKSCKDLWFGGMFTEAPILR